MTLEQAAKQYSEQNHFTSLTQCFKEVVNSEYVRQEKIKFALQQLYKFRESTFGKGIDIIKKLENELT
jgi:hypothetical protein